MKRIQACEVRDRDGEAADTVTVDLVDWPPAAIPRRGAEFQVYMGYGLSLAFMGRFEIEDIEIHVLPNRMILTGRAAELSGASKANRERSWDDISLQELVRQIANENGWQAVVDSEIGSHRYEWIAQINESDVHFLRRIANRHGAIFTVKSGTLIFAIKGEGVTPSGAQLTPVIIRPGGFISDTCTFISSERDLYDLVASSYPDRETGQRVEVTAKVPERKKSLAPGSSPLPPPRPTEGILRINEQFADEPEAKSAAIAKAKKLARSEWEFRVVIPGDPTARAGAPLTFIGVRSGMDDLPFIIETATHTYSKSGYTTTLEGRLQS
jgi:uncharacterized protein